MKKYVVLTVLTAMLISLSSLAQAEELTPQLCKEKAIAAANLLKEKGEAALAEIEDPNGPFRFADGAGYVWGLNDLRCISTNIELSHTRS